MNKKIKKIQFLIIIIILLTLSIKIPPILAEEEANLMSEIANQNIMFGNEAGLEYSDPQETIINIINIVLGFIGLLLLVIILYSGFEWMTSGGNEEKISKARKRLTSAIIGLGIVMGAWIIAQTIMLIIQGGDINWTWWNQ